MSGIIKAARVLLGAPRQIGGVMDLTRPDSGVTPEERAALIGAGGVIGGQQPGQIIDLAEYRARRSSRPERGPAA